MPHQCRVLLAEDNPVNQDVGRAMLETFGCHVDVAENGLEALRLLESNRYDLIFMDCQMPKMNGWEAASKIRETEKESFRKTPIVALTAYILDEERDRCRSSGMDDYLGKPFGLHELSEVLRRWVKLDQNGNVSEVQSPRVPTPSAEQGTDSGNIAHECEHHDLACLDSKVLDNLKSAFSSNSSKMLEMVINLYLGNSQSLLYELRIALREMDTVAIRRVAHTLRSSSANLGANVLADYCKEVEELSRQGHTRVTEELIFQIESEYEKVQTALKVILRAGS